MSGLPDGDYRLIFEIDPKKRLLEINDGDNVSCLLLRISASSQTVAVLDASGCNGSPGEPVVVQSIEPNKALQGSVVSVTITGSGFAAGMTVRLANGSNPRPIVSNVVLVDANTITADVTVKSGGTGQDRIWDVRVGSGVLVDGFEVLLP